MNGRVSGKALLCVVAAAAAAVSVGSSRRGRAAVAADRVRDSWGWTKRAGDAIAAAPYSQAAHPVLGWIRCQPTGADSGHCQSVLQEHGLVLRAEWHLRQPSAWRVIVEVESAGGDLQCADVTPFTTRVREARTTVSRIALCETGEGVAVLLDHSPDIRQNSTYRLEYMSSAFLAQNPSYLSALFDSPAVPPRASRAAGS